MNILTKISLANKFTPPALIFSKYNVPVRGTKFASLVIKAALELSSQFSTNAGSTMKLNDLHLDLSYNAQWFAQVIWLSALTACMTLF
jgi:hypothetical protein